MLLAVFGILVIFLFGSWLILYSDSNSKPIDQNIVHYKDYTIDRDDTLVYINKHIDLKV